MLPLLMMFQCRKTSLFRTAGSRLSRCLGLTASAPQHPYSLESAVGEGGESHLRPPSGGETGTGRFRRLRTASGNSDNDDVKDGDDDEVEDDDAFSVVVKNEIIYT